MERDGGLHLLVGAGTAEIRDHERQKTGNWCKAVTQKRKTWSTTLMRSLQKSESWDEVMVKKNTRFWLEEEERMELVKYACLLLGLGTTV